MKKQNEEKRFISIFNDYGFKVTFGNEENTLFLKKALQALIASDVPIEKLTFSNTEIKGFTNDSRSGYIDIFCEDKNGNQFIVEMQQYDMNYFLHRLKYYAFHKFDVMVKKGEYRFNNLKKIYAIVIVPEKMFPKYKEYHHIVKNYNQHHELIDDQISYIVVELGKFEKTESQLSSNLDKLLFFMKTIDSAVVNEQLPDYFSEEWLSNAIRVLETSNFTQEERAMYQIGLAKRGAYIQHIEDEKTKEREKVTKEVEKKTKELLAIKLINQEKLSLMEIADFVELTLKDVKTLKEKMKK